MRRILAAAVLCAMIVTLWGCGTGVPDLSGMICAVVLEQEHIAVDEAVRWVRCGADVSYTVQAEVGYDIISVDYENYELKPQQDSTYILTLYDVQTPVRVALQIQKAQAVICYHAQEGTVIGSENNCFYENYDLTYRKRANTALGTEKLSNPGHTLVGWNTQPDMSGETIGLGSRVTVPADTNYLDLYAQWIPWTDSGAFTYRNHGGYIELTGYLGSDDVVAVPGTIDGLPVTIIAAGCFDGCQASQIILPSSVQTVAAEAFRDCALESLLFFDNLMEIGDDSFINCPNFSTVRINASHLPSYTNRSRHSHYADKIDMLILTLEDEKPRMVFMAGSSMWFSLDGAQVDSYFAGAYTPVNVALNGFYSGTAQFEVLKNYLRSGDVVIHAPEACSEYQLMTTDEMTENMFTCFELNYDLFAGVDIRNLTKVFSSYTEYNSVRQALPQTSYDARDNNEWIDQYGCIPFTRPAVNGNEDLLDDARVATDMLTEDAIGRLNYYYTQIAEITGTPVLFAFAPINYDGLPQEDRDPARWQAFEDILRQGLNGDARIITSFADAVFRGSSFYYTDFHLNSEATVIHTQILCQGIRAALEEVEDP